MTDLSDIPPLDWAAALELARESIDSGAALRTLETLIKVSNDSR